MALNYESTGQPQPVRKAAGGRLATKGARLYSEDHLHPHTWRWRQRTVLAFSCPETSPARTWAVPVSLPSADDGAGLPEYAAAVLTAIGNREPQRVVVVAQSLAGFTAPLVCKQYRLRCWCW